MNPRSTNCEADALTTTPLRRLLASLLVVSLGKALNGTPPSLCGRQTVGPSSLPVVVAQSDERQTNRACAHTRERKPIKKIHVCVIMHAKQLFNLEVVGYFTQDK